MVCEWDYGIYVRKWIWPELCSIINLSIFILSQYHLLSTIEGRQAFAYFSVSRIGKKAGHYNQGMTEMPLWVAYKSFSLIDGVKRALLHKCMQEMWIVCYIRHQSEISKFVTRTHMKYFHMGIFVIPGVCLIRKYGSQNTALFSVFQCFSGYRVCYYIRIDSISGEFSNFWPSENAFFGHTNPVAKTNEDWKWWTGSICFR